MPLLALWSPPRCRSTAFWRMIAERGDLLVIHEPFCHLADHGYAQVAGCTVGTEAELISVLLKVSAERPVFFKDTMDHPHSAVLADQALLREAVHTFLIRDPREAIASHYALDPQVTRDEIGFAHLYEAYRAVEAAGGHKPVVIDANDLASQPVTLVAAWCEQVGLTFLPDSLNWAPGERNEWAATARCHTDVSRSSGFHAAARSYPATVDTHPHLAAYHAFHEPYYLRLLEQRLSV
jgi:hypothetical protein